jgi:hypothetical protein
MDREDADMEHREPVREEHEFGSGDRREREVSRGYDERDDRDRRERSSRDRVSGTGMRIGVDCARVYPY